VLVRAAINTDPDWAVRTAREHAETIMNAGKAEHYHHAVRWLNCAGAAYRSLKREREWREYRTHLLLRHNRKRKLITLLQRLSSS
jgi:uncharacterized Zn finger protein